MEKETNWTESLQSIIDNNTIDEKYLDSMKKIYENDLKIQKIEKNLL